MLRDSGAAKSQASGIDYDVLGLPSLTIAEEKEAARIKIVRRHTIEPSAQFAFRLDETRAQNLERGLLEAFAESNDLIRDDYVMPDLLRFEVRQCAKASSPSYDPTAQVVVMCLGYAERLLREGERANITQGGFTYARDVSRFIIAHEVGHALIDIFRLPVIGREEDAGDQFATFLFVEHRRAEPVMSALVHFSFVARSAANDRDAFTDVHSLDAQRDANLSCWLFGSDSNEFRGFGNLLPRTRRKNCAYEYAQLRDSWQRLLAAHKKP